MKVGTTDISVFITKTLKFRAWVKEFGKVPYQVTVGGESWKRGKGQKYKKAIIIKVHNILASLEIECTRMGG